MHQLSNQHNCGRLKDECKFTMILFNSLDSNAMLIRKITSN